jgi:hypothetical protein
LLAIRFLSCDSSLICSSGLLGVFNMAAKFDMTAKNIKQATLDIVSTACTERADPPNAPKAYTLRPYCDKALVRHVKATIEVYDADAAADEQLAGNMIKGRKLDDETLDANTFPGLKIVNKDKAHASRRLTSRGWACDDELKGVMDMVLENKSLIQRIQHSEVFSHLFNDNIRALEDHPVDGKRIKDLKSKKHRFESHQRPFGRAVLFFVPLVQTASQIMRGRYGKQEAKDAERFLRDMTVEKALLLAAMADAGDESLALTRWLDQEKFDIAALSEECSAYLARISALFVDGLCWTTGYSAFMLRTLKENLVVQVDGSAKNLGSPGGVPRELLSRIEGRMTAWVKISHKIMEAEFPSFEAVQAFKVFHLAPFKKDRKSLGRLHVSDGHLESLARLGQLLDVDVEKLRDDYTRFLPLALAEVSNRDVSNFEAWQSALTKPRRNRDKDNAGAALRQVMIRYGAWGFSTSGVERTFSDAQRLAGLNRADMSDSLTADEILLVNSTLTAAEMTQVLVDAQAQWAVVYGDARQGRFNSRLTSGKPPPLKQNSEAAFTKGRRAAVQEQANSRVAVQSEDIQVPVACLTAKPEKEIVFQSAKLQASRLAALEGGALLADEVGPQMHDELLTLQINRAGNDLKREAASANHSLKPTRVSFELNGLRVFLAARLEERDVLERHCRQERARVVADKAAANVFVVPDVSAPSLRTLWCCILGGHTVADSRYLLSTGKKGSSVIYKKSLSVKRVAFISDEFLTSNPGVAEIIVTKAGDAGGKWKLVASQAEFLEAYERNGQANMFIAFVSRREQRHQIFRHVKTKLTAADAVMWLTNIQSSSLG